MSGPSPNDRIEACVLGALAGDEALAADLIAAIECLVETGGLDEDALRAAGLGVQPPGGPGGIGVRTLAYALLTPLDRPRLRRGAYRCAAVGAVDEGSAIAAVATAVIASDLGRGFDLEQALIRCHQTLLEEAPTALLTRLRPLEDEAPLSGDADPTMALQLAITALNRASGIDAVAAVLAGDATATSRTLAGALAGIRDGFEGWDASAIVAHPLRDRARAAAALLVSAATPATAAAQS